jgi:hypothetical protein
MKLYFAFFMLIIYVNTFAASLIPVNTPLEVVEFEGPSEKTYFNPYPNDFCFDPNGVLLEKRCILREVKCGAHAQLYAGKPVRVQFEIKGLSTSLIMTHAQSSKRLYYFLEGSDQLSNMEVKLGPGDKFYIPDLPLGSTISFYSYEQQSAGDKTYQNFTFVGRVQGLKEVNILSMPSPGGKYVHFEVDSKSDVDILKLGPLKFTIFESHLINMDPPPVLTNGTYYVRALNDHGGKSLPFIVQIDQLTSEIKLKLTQDNFLSDPLLEKSLSVTGSQPNNGFNYFREVSDHFKILFTQREGSKTLSLLSATKLLIRSDTVELNLLDDLVLDKKVKEFGDNSGRNILFIPRTNGIQALRTKLIALKGQLNLELEARCGELTVTPLQQSYPVYSDLGQILLGSILTIKTHNSFTTEFVTVNGKKMAFEFNSSRPNCGGEINYQAHSILEKREGWVRLAPGPWGERGWIKKSPVTITALSGPGEVIKINSKEVIFKQSAKESKVLPMTLLYDSKGALKFVPDFCEIGE